MCLSLKTKDVSSSRLAHLILSYCAKSSLRWEIFHLYYEVLATSLPMHTSNYTREWSSPIEWPWMKYNEWWKLLQLLAQSHKNSGAMWDMRACHLCCHSHLRLVSLEIPLHFCDVVGLSNPICAKILWYMPLLFPMFDEYICVSWIIYGGASLCGIVRFGRQSYEEPISFNIWCPIWVGYFP